MTEDWDGVQADPDGSVVFTPACRRCWGWGDVPSVVGGTDEFGSQDQDYVPCPDCEDR